MNALKEIRYRIQINPEVNARYARLKILDRIKQTQNEWKGAELSAEIMGNCLHKFFKYIVNKLNNSEKRATADVKKVWLKATLK